MDLTSFHTLLLRAEPTETQRTLYEAASWARGFNEEAYTDEHAEATLMLAVYLVTTGMSKGESMLLFVPPGKVEPMLAQVRRTLSVVTKPLRPFSEPRNRFRADSIMTHFNRVRVGCKTKWPEVAPEHWVSLGVSKSTAPIWMRSVLL